MSNTRKVCLYKGCDQQPGKTLFRFPAEKSRFYAWVQFAGVDLKGEINIEDPRFLCEKHFLPNYISQQSRRKMLVHTAIPIKYKENLVLDEGEPKKFTIIGEKKQKSRRSNYTPLNSESDSSLTSPPHTTNPKRKLEDPIEELEQYEYVEEYPASDEIVEQEELTIETMPKEKIKQTYVVVKQGNNNHKKIINYIRPALTKKEETSFFLTEEGNLAATSSNEEELKIEYEKPFRKRVVEQAPQTKPFPTLENCTEFIFSGEIYVQMPKRVFDAERERLTAETEKYKELLAEIKLKIEGTLG